MQVQASWNMPFCIRLSTIHSLLSALPHGTSMLLEFFSQMLSAFSFLSYIWISIHRQIEIPNAYTMNPGLAHTVSFPIYRIHTYFSDVQIFAVFVNESETAKINTRKKFVLTLLRYLYPTDSHLLDPKRHQEHRTTHTDVCSYTECALNRKIAALTFQNRESINPRGKNS